MADSILVVGAGELGLAILTALTAHPSLPTTKTKLSVLLRAETVSSSDPAKKAHIENIRSLGITIETGDFINAPSELIPVFERYAVVVQCAGYGMQAGTQLGVTKAVLAAGVPRYFPWQFGMDYEAIGSGSSQPLFDEMLEVRGLLRGQGRTRWTVVSTGLFMSYLFIPDFGVVDLPGRTVRALGGWENNITVTNPRDIGTMVASAVFEPEGTEDRVIYIGSDTISYRGLAEVLEGVFGVELKREEWGLEFLAGRLEEEPENPWVKYQNVFGKGVGVSWAKEETLNFQRGIELVDIKGYVEENMEAFSKDLRI